MSTRRLWYSIALLHAVALYTSAQAAPYFVWYLPSRTPLYPLLVINPDNKPYYRCTLQLFRTYTKRDGSQGFDTRNYYFAAPPNSPVSPGAWNSQEHGGNTITSTNVYCLQ